MVPVGRLTLVRTFPKSELIRAMSFVAIPGLIGPMLGPIAGGFIVGYFHWRIIFFVNLPIGLLGLYMVFRHLPDYRAEHTHPLDVPGLILFGSGVALLSYVLEVFGEHRLGWRVMLGLLALSALLLTSYGVRATRTEFPLLRLALFRIRSFRSAVSGSFFTRLGIGGIPFLFPLLYQVGLGFSPIQSGLMMMPQAFAAMSLKLTMPIILRRFGYRNVLISNTVMLGLLIALFGTIGAGTPVWLIVAEVFVYGFFTSLQYTSMNTLTYADVADRDASKASSIASTAQQMSLSFGVASASLVTAWFLGHVDQTNPAQAVPALHKAFCAMGVMTVISSLTFWGLRAGDGANVSNYHPVLPEDPVLKTA